MAHFCDATRVFANHELRRNKILLFECLEVSHWGGGARREQPLRLDPASSF